MLRNSQEQPGEAIAPGAEGDYFTLPVALVHGRINTSKINPYSPQEAAMFIRNGLIPDQAGTLELPDGTLAAFDLIDLKIVNDKARVAPAPKDAVCEDSREIRRPGAVVLAEENGERIKVVARVERAERAEWMKGFGRSVGGTALKFMWDKQYEITEISDSGIVLAREPRRYF